jgi:sulfotransferase family protein
VASSPAARKPIKVVFIAGVGRSGSTLFGRLAALSPAVEALGEVRQIWSWSYRENQLCGCGTPFHECEFWNQASRYAFNESPATFDADAVAALRARFDRKKYIPQLLWGSPHHRIGREFSRYAQLLTSLYQAIADTSGRPVLLDSSLVPTHGFVLSRLPAIELHTLHLVRDPRAVAFSWQRRRLRPEIHNRRELMPIWSARYAATAWLKDNLFAELLVGASASYRRVRYEDFVTSPSTVLSQMALDCEFDPSPFKQIPTGGLTLPVTHSVAGNPLRFQRDPVEIRIDDAWRKSLSARDRRLVELIAAPLMARYGYLTSPSAASQAR